MSNKIGKEDYLYKLENMFLVIQSIEGKYTTEEILCDFLKSETEDLNTENEETIKNIVKQTINVLIKQKMMLKIEAIPEDLDIDLSKDCVIYSLCGDYSKIKLQLKNDRVEIEEVVAYKSNYKENEELGK